MSGNQSKKELKIQASLLPFENGILPEYRYGYGRCTPDWMQKLHNPRCLVACLAVGGLCLGMVVNGLVPISISTLEKRFDLTSTETGIFASMYKTTSLAVTIPLAHYATKGHKGRYLGLAALTLGIGSLVCSLPQIFSGPYEYGQEQIEDVCLLNSTSQNTKSSSVSKVYFGLLLLGQILHGLGGAPMSILAVTFIDDNVSQLASPLYTGIYMGCRNVLGPAIGYVAGGLFLRIYGDIGKVDLDSVDLSGPSDTRWYGAWWIGFLLAGLFEITVAFPVLGFAKQLPIAEKHRQKDVDQSDRGSKSPGVSFGENLKDLPKAIWCLMRNPTTCCLILQQVAEAFLLAFLITFTPKLVENFFNYSSSDASMLSGAILLTGGFAGTIFGGYLIRRFKLRCRGIMQLSIIFNCLCLPLYFIFLIQCNAAPFAGVTSPYQNRSLSRVDELQLNSDCNSACHCSNFYNPVCDSYTGVTYYSPCHASCTVEIHDTSTDKKVWSNCSCTENNNMTTKLTSGICSLSCPVIPVFVALFTVLALATFTASIPTQQALLRSVQFDQRTLAMGLLIICDGIGVFLGSVSFGHTIDLACVLWKTDRFAGKRSCLKYTRSQLAFSLVGFGFGAKLVALILIVLAYKFYRSPKTVEEENDEK